MKPEAGSSKLSHGLINMRAFLSLEHISQQYEELVGNVRRISVTGEDATVLRGQIADEVEQHLLRPEGILLRFPVGCDSPESADEKCDVGLFCQRGY